MLEVERLRAKVLASARTRRGHILVGISEGALAQHRSRGLLHRRSVVSVRVGDLLCAFMIELIKRIVHIAGITTQPNEDWMMQVARSLTDEFGGFLIGKSHLISRS
jgi:hypothetical protein